MQPKIIKKLENEASPAVRALAAGLAITFLFCLVENAFICLTGSDGTQAQFICNYIGLGMFLCTCLAFAILRRNRKRNEARL